MYCFNEAARQKPDPGKEKISSGKLTGSAPSGSSVRDPFVKSKKMARDPIHHTFDPYSKDSEDDKNPPSPRVKDRPAESFFSTRVDICRGTDEDSAIRVLCRKMGGGLAVGVLTRELGRICSPHHHITP